MAINDTDATHEKHGNLHTDDEDSAMEIIYEDEGAKVSLVELGPQESYIEKAKEIAGRSRKLDITQSDDLLERPYNFDAVYRRFESSALLRPNIDAYVTNVDSFGHYFIPSVDLASDNLRDRVEAAMLYEQSLQVTNGEIRAIDLKDPADVEIDQKIAELQKAARFEYMRLKAFFAYACPRLGFIGLRRKLRQDLEVTGNAWWELLRNAHGELCRIHYINPINMYIADPTKHKEFLKPVDVTISVKHTDITWVPETEPRYFHLFVKRLGGDDGRAYYKDFGDPRIVSKKTGQVYSTPNSLQREEGHKEQATEVLHFKIHSPRSEYGIFRWSGSMASVLGSIELDEVNYEYFDNNVIPPLALLVSGGALGAEAAQRIERTIEDRIKGKKGINRLLIIEARGYKAAGDPGPTPAPKLQFVPLRAVQQTDALFQSYDQRNEEKVAAPFRLPRMLRGIDTQINKATATVSMRLAEEQIFEPEREAFDQVVNSQMLSDLNVKFWLFRSNAPIVRDPEKMSEMIEKLVKVGVLLPGEARDLLQDIFNRQFLEIKEKWTSTPMPVILSQLKSGKEEKEEEEPEQPKNKRDEDEPGTSNKASPAKETGEGNVALEPMKPMQALGDEK